MYIDVPIHDFLLAHDDTLLGSAEKVPTIRSCLEDAPETSTVFKLSNVIDNPTGFSRPLVEFCGVWPAPDVYQTGNWSDNYVNPHGCDAHRYPDVVCRCACGAPVRPSPHGPGVHPIGSDGHDDGCNNYDRWEARARLARKREAMYERLIVQHGWAQPELAVRTGVSQQQVSQEMDEYGLDPDELRDRFRRRAGNTYAVLRTQGHASQELSDIYDVGFKTLGRWAREYGDYAPEGKGTNTVWVRSSG